MPAPVRIVLVEDNDVFRETLEILFALQDDLEVVASLPTGFEAPSVCAELVPDVVVMDYRMPGPDGAEATAAVLEASPSSRVVCLTASLSENDTDRLLDAGAVASLTKDGNLDEIVAAIRAAAGREARA